MGTRYTEKDANNCANRLARILGIPFLDEEFYEQQKEYGLEWRDAQIGGLRLDCNPIYGGCVVERIINRSGGVTHIGERMPPRQFCEAVHLAEDLLHLYEKLKEEAPFRD